MNRYPDQRAPSEISQEAAVVKSTATPSLEVGVPPSDQLPEVPEQQVQVTFEEAKEISPPSLPVDQHPISTNPDLEEGEIEEWEKQDFAGLLPTDITVPSVKKNPNIKTYDRDFLVRFKHIKTKPDSMSEIPVDLQLGGSGYGPRDGQNGSK